MHRLYYTSLLHSVVNTSVKQLIHLLEGSERAIKRYDCTATRSHCKNNNASLPTRRVTSRRCQAIVLKSYTLLLSHRAALTEKTPVKYCACSTPPSSIARRVAIGVKVEYQDKEKRQSVLQQAFHIPTFALLFSHTKLGPNNSSFEYSSYDSHTTTVLPGAQSTIVVFVESIRRRKEDHYTR